MYVGHFAIGLAMKAYAPKAKPLPIILGVGFLDVIDGLLIMLGADRVTPNLHAGPYLFFDLTFIDWDHSLLMAIVLSLIWGALFLKDRKLAGLAALACFSHFLADLPMHNADLALFPYAAQHMGFGLWGKMGTGSWILEGMFCAALVSLAWVVSAKRGVSLLWPTVVMAVLFFNMSPWLSPMKTVATFSEPAAHMVHGLLVTAGFLLPGILLSWLLVRAERKGRGELAAA